MNFKVAALLTCHNRMSKTLKCLAALYINTLPRGYGLDVFLVDDGSKDGTSQAIASQYPGVRIIQGNGDLYWCGGMRVAFAKAMEGQFDAYLLLNDDTVLYPDALDTLFKSLQLASNVSGKSPIVVGTVVDPNTGQHTYGGRVSRGWKQPLYFDFVAPQALPIVCDTANANCLLIPSQVADSIGNLDSIFAHGRADYDYCLRAKRKGFRTYVASAVVGACSTNPPEDLAKFKRLTFLQKWEYLTTPKQYPLYEWLIFTWRHAGVFWLVHWLRPYRRLFQ